MSEPSGGKPILRLSRRWICAKCVHWDTSVVSKSNEDKRASRKDWAETKSNLEYLLTC